MFVFKNFKSWLVLKYNINSADVNQILKKKHFE